ncbi:MAG: hypothetical protein ACP5VE_12470 [Chthonomonadales bacterium]
MLELVQVTLKKGGSNMPAKVAVEGPVGRGAEGDVYFTRDGKYAVKVYHGLAPERERLLEYVMGLFRSLSHSDERYILPPLALVDRLGNEPRVGFVMRRAPEQARELATLVMSPREAASQFQSGRTWADYLKVARDVATALMVLHGKGCAHSDIHYSNFLADLREGSAVMLEADGIVVPGFLPPHVAGMAGFMAPEIITRGEKPNERTDRHSMAVLILHTLLFRNVMQPRVEWDNDLQRSEELGWGEKALFSEHPSDRTNRPSTLGVPLFEKGCLSYKMLPPPLQELTERAFIIGLHDPDKRPSSREWEEELAFAVDVLYRCVRCGMYFPYPYWLQPLERRRCPFCGTSVAKPAPHVLRLYDPSGHSYYGTSRRLVLGHGFQIFADVVDPMRMPPHSRKSEPSVGHLEWDQTRLSWRLVNDSPGEISIVGADGLTASRLSRGQSASLARGSRIQFGAGSRILVVEE